MLLLSPGLATFLFAVSSIPRCGTVADRHVLIPAAIGLALIAAFVVHALHRADHPLIDLRLFQNRVITHANVTMLVFATAFFGAGLLLPSYFQQVLHHTPMQAGVHMIPQGLGAMLTMRLTGPLVDRQGPGKIVLVGIALITVGLGTFAFGVARQAHYLPTLLVGLAIMGLGMGCTMMPLSVASVQALTPHQIARGTTLMSVSHQVGGSMGTALMSMILTNQFNRSENITAANKLAPLQQKAAASGVPVDPSAIPRQSLVPGFSADVLHDLSHAYTAVFVIAVVLVVFTIIPASFLPKKAGQPNSRRIVRLPLEQHRRDPHDGVHRIRLPHRAFTASLSHSVENPCTRDHAASWAPAGSARALGSRSVATPRDSSAPAAASAAASSASETSSSDLLNITW